MALHEPANPLVVGRRIADGGAFSVYKFRPGHAEGLAAELALEVAHSLFEAAQTAVRRHVVVSPHRHRAALRHQPAPTIQQVGRDAMAPRYRREALS